MPAGSLRLRLLPQFYDWSKSEKILNQRKGLMSISQKMHTTTGRAIYRAVAWELGAGEGMCLPKVQGKHKNRVDPNKPSEKSGEMCCMTLGMY